MKATGKFILGSILLLSPFFTYAHPGNTAADGCHYCRTNCSKWGVAWDERHCHNAKSVNVPIVSPLPKPKVIPAVAPQTATSKPAATTNTAVTPVAVSTSTTGSTFKSATKVFIPPPPSIAQEQKRPGFFLSVFGTLFGWFGN